VRDTVIVNEAVGEIRKEPGHATEQVSQVVLGTPLTVLRTTDERRWLRVQCPDGYKGWIRSWAVHPLSRRELAAFQSGPLVEVDALSARVRADPGLRSDGIREATLGVRLPRLGRSGLWIRVELPDSQRGYLHARDLLVDQRTLRPRPRTRDLYSVVRSAMRFLGVPYQWGGVTAKGLDCSGLVQTVFHLHGVLLPRDAKDQFRWARKETYVYRAPEGIQFGHLVFFGPSDEAVGHVGISLGNSEFLHARGRVRVNSLLPGNPLFDRDLYRQFRGASPILLQQPPG
jgi:gamma-D-glutamyl-L-lysine dipeptidyl-peptidase